MTPEQNLKVILTMVGCRQRWASRVHVVVAGCPFCKARSELYINTVDGTLTCTRCGGYSPNPFHLNKVQRQSRFLKRRLA
jgi:hypothetical protein